LPSVAGLVFCFAKVRYRGLRKNAHRPIFTCALAKLFIARRHLLRCDVAQSVRLGHQWLGTPKTSHQNGAANPTLSLAAAMSMADIRSHSLFRPSLGFAVAQTRSLSA
jgi:hypothetical protein